jgi:hypothetical protein
MAYPASLDSFATNIDDVSIVTAADMNAVQDAIVALETFVGINPPPDLLNTANALVRRGPTGDFAGNNIVAVGQLSSNAVGAGHLSGLYLNSTQPAIALKKSDAGTNEKLWDLYLAATQMILRLVNDAESSATDIITITRSGITGSSVAIAIPVSVAQILVASAGIAIPTSAGTAIYATDASATGGSVTLADNAAAYVFSGSPTNVFAGEITVYESSTDKSVGKFLVGGGTCEVIGQTNAQWANANTASKNCLYVASNAVVIHNRRGSSRTYKIKADRMGASN